MVNPLSPSISISPVSAYLNVGQSQTFNSTVSSGTLPYSFQWCLNGTAVPGANSSSWTFTPTSAGSYTIYANVTDNVGIQVTSNNAIVTVTGVHDVDVINLVSSRTVIGQGFIATVNFTVANQGDYTETFNATAYANTTVIDSENITLPIGNSTALTFTWNTTGIAYGSYTLWANATNNNYSGGTVTVTIPGDINGDFKVSLVDLVLSANAYGTTPASGGTPGVAHAWNPNADIDNNGVVGLTDLVILALHYGQHYP